MALQPISARDLVARQFFAPEQKFNVLGGIQGAIEQGRTDAAAQRQQQLFAQGTQAAFEGTASAQQISELFAANPERAKQVLEGAGAFNDRSRQRVAETAFRIQSAPFNQRAGMIQQAAAQVQQGGGDPNRILSLLNMGEQQQNEQLTVFQQAALSVQQRQAQDLSERQFGLSERQVDLQAANITSQIRERGRPKTPALTSKAKDLVSAGFMPGTPEFQSEMLALLQKTGTTVNVGAGEKEEVKQIAKVQGRRFEKIIEEGEKAAQTLATIDQFQNIDVTTGALEPAKAATAAVFKSLGLNSIADSIANVTNAQALQSLTNRAVNDALNAASGVQTDGDAARARKTVVSLGGDQRANEFIANTIKAVALRKKTRSDFISGLVDSGANTFSQANTEWGKFIKKNPSLSSIVKNPATGLPLYFHEFEQTARRNNPGVSQQEINNAWRSVHGN